MSMSRCPKPECGGFTFELQELKVNGAQFRMYAVQCSACGAVVAVKEFENTNALVIKRSDDLEQKISRVAERVDRIARKVGVV